MKKFLIAIVAGIGGALMLPAAAEAVKPRPPVIVPCPDWATDCKPVVVHAPPAGPKWLSGR